MMKALVKNTRKNIVLLFMELPGIIWLILFWAIPLFGIVLAFKQYDYSLGVLGSPWVGFENFKFFAASKSVMFRLIRNTVGYYLLFTVVGTVLNVGLALMIHECTKRYFAKVAHTIMIFPTFISYIAVTFIVSGLLNPKYGFINTVLEALGQDPINWYAKAGAWPIILLLVKVWKDTGYGCILYLSALAGMDQEIFEAARIDGANKRQQIWYITLPQLTSMISIILLLGLGGIMSSNTGLFYQVTKNTGLLYETTQTIDAYVLNALVGNTTSFGILAAITLFQTAIGSTLTIVVNLIVRKVEPDNALF